MSRDRNQPPPTWADWAHGFQQLTDEIYMQQVDDTAPPRMWHWCPAHGRWIGRDTSLHTVVSRNPLHLEPSLLCPDCGCHGWIREGRWIPA